MIHFCIILVLLSFSISSMCQDGPVVKTPSGDILGNREVSRNGTEYFSFLGIPYAEPPVGELRFKPPVPYAKWEGIYSAVEDVAPCPQPDLEDTSEDCLHLNVYTRRISEVEDPRPVLVFIHGGAFISGTGDSESYGPDYLMDHDIVLVTFNYRLGALGLLSTGDQYAPGNYGLKDQVEALRWIQHNIQFFGGDMTRVTLAGQSAGAVSVGLHLLSPMTRGLFHRAITASGSAANEWAVDREPLRTAKMLASVLKCPTNNSQSLIDCVRDVPARDIISAYKELKAWHNLPEVIFKPVVEGHNEGVEEFLIKDPYQSLNEGDIAHVPILVGTTKDEFMGLALPIVENKERAADLSKNWNKIAPIAFEFARNDTVSESLRSFYFGGLDKPITNGSFEELGELFADSLIIFGTIQSAQVISEKIPDPVYLYQFNYQGKCSNEYWPDTNETFGVLHADDLIYLFYSEDKCPFINSTDEDGPIVDRFTTLWKNFMATGNPTPESLKVLQNAVWKPYKNKNPVYLDINLNLTVVEGIYYEERMEFWNELFPIKNRF